MNSMSRKKGTISPIRVLMIAPPLDVVGGQSIQGLRLRQAIGRLPGVEISFLPSPPPIPAALRPLSQIKFVRTIFNALAFQAYLLRRIRHVDIVHVFTPSFWAFMWVPAPTLIVARLLGRKTILNYRDGRAEEHLRNWRSAKPLISVAHALVSNSQFLVDVFAKFGLHASYIFNIIDPSRLRFRERGKLRPVFLHNRILEPLYNVPCTLRAFSLIQARYPEASLTVAHDGPSRAEMEALAGELQLKNVQFVGRVSQERMRDLYDSADIYLTSPDFDCMPGSLLECYASGLPIVATRAGGIPYILFHEETGLLVDKNDHEGMAAAAFRLLEEDGLAQRLTTAGRAELDKYDTETVARQWLDFYARLMRGEGIAAPGSGEPSGQIHDRGTNSPSLVNVVAGSD